MHEAGSERDAYLLKALALVTQHLPSGIAVLDATGHVMLVNEPCQRLLGLQATDARLWTEQVAGAQVRVVSPVVSAELEEAERVRVSSTASRAAP